MKCEAAQKKLVSAIEAKGNVALRAPILAIHLITCATCRKEAQRLRQALSVLATEKPKAKVPETMASNIMQRIAFEAPLQHPGAQNPVSFRDWIVVGLILFIALCTLPFSSESPFVLIITVSIFLTLYGSLLIGSHLEELAEHFGLRQ
ncbi:hypothetical protein [Gracilinema caldarium]|uniref:hypothetical protein n=1 Tax=Gracilinema caldarium TaxID=215591 RepID=UPI0026F077C9|nr:hypothetical protein [Gracilinema caldarium]